MSAETGAAVTAEGDPDAEEYACEEEAETEAETDGPAETGAAVTWELDGEADSLTLAALLEPNDDALADEPKDWASAMTVLEAKEVAAVVVVSSSHG